MTAIRKESVIKRFIRKATKAIVERIAKVIKGRRRGPACAPQPVPTAREVLVWGRRLAQIPGGFVDTEVKQLIRQLQALHRQRHKYHMHDLLCWTRGKLDEVALYFTKEMGVPEDADESVLKAVELAAEEAVVVAEVWELLCCSVLERLLTEGKVQAAADAIHGLNMQPPAALGVREDLHITPEGLDKAVAHLRAVTKVCTPLGKMDCIGACINSICSSVYNSKGEAASLGADDLISFLVWILLQSGTVLGEVEIILIDSLMPDRFLYGMTDYYLTTLNAAATNLSKMGLEIREAESIQSDGYCSDFEEETTSEDDSDLEEDVIRVSTEAMPNSLSQVCSASLTTIDNIPACVTFNLYSPNNLARIAKSVRLQQREARRQKRLLHAEPPTAASKAGPLTTSV